MDYRTPEVALYKLAKWNGRLRFRCTPEYRTMPMVWYVPPLSPIVDLLKDQGHDAENSRTCSAIEAASPLNTLVELFYRWRYRGRDLA